MSERKREEQRWSDNPLLRAWLAKQEAAFPAWVEQTGCGWDFTPESLDRLEDLIRSRFTSSDEVDTALDEPFLAVASWYLGEVQNRHFGTMWQCRPDPPANDLQDNRPFVIATEDPLDRYDEEEAEEREELGLDEDYRPLCAPAIEFPALFLRGPQNRLRDALDQYEREPSN